MYYDTLVGCSSIILPYGPMIPWCLVGVPGYPSLSYPSSLLMYYDNLIWIMCTILYLVTIVRSSKAILCLVTIVRPNEVLKDTLHCDWSRRRTPVNPGHNITGHLWLARGMGKPVIPSGKTYDITCLALIGQETVIQPGKTYDVSSRILIGQDLLLYNMVTQHIQSLCNHSTTWFVEPSHYTRCCQK